MAREFIIRPGNPGSDAETLVEVRDVSPAQETLSITGLLAQVPELREAALRESPPEGGVFVEDWLPDTLIHMNDGAMSYARRLRAIQFNTSWELQESSEAGDPPRFVFSGLYNDWRKPLAFTWTPPKDMLILVVFCEQRPGYTTMKWLSAPGPGGTETTTMYLLSAKLAVNEPNSSILSVRQWVSLPFPNLHHPSQMLCTGGIALPSRYHQMTWAERSEANLTAWAANRWNSDLLSGEDREEFNTLVGFGLDGNQIPVPRDWINSCVREVWDPNDFPAELRCRGLVRRINVKGWKKYVCDYQ